ncbi:class I adenylate-forming enzyme family protein [Pseudoduganella aquatica]|uniref:AMP-binding protein n=1 Tax=Pseudoduganella aquatica TaxID=2660641 RepID=A0A7X4H8M3_9BURK|nr:class I adenylate-forming enzyme family protein [Pseudoduganella aquatica]MYN06274.1 AMP-binding protein [Pseudoduganella aquatica]
MDIAALLAGLPPRISDIPRRWAERAPHAPALREGERVWTYGELAAAVDATAQRLRELGVRPGDRLMVVAENCVAQIALIFAAASMDAWAVNANSRLSAREIAQFREHSGARRVIYCCGSAAGAATAASPEAAAHGERDGAQRESWLFGEWMIGPLNEAAQPEPVAAGADFSARQPAALIYTTGTTGQSKGVMLSHRNLLFVAAVSSTLRGLTPADRAYGVLPISHVYGLASVMLGTLYAGACLHLQPRFNADALLRALREDQLTILQGVPAMYARLLEILGQPGAGAGADGAARRETLGASLRFIYAGGSPLDPVLKRQAEALLGQPLHNGYGMTESSPTISQTRLDAPRGDTSVGYAIPGVETRIVPAQDATGELWVRGPNVMLGYYKEPSLTAAAIDADGWLNTGDVARQDADGALFIVGRSKELIIRSGFNVYPLEVETVLNAHPAVAQSAVVGRTVAGGDEEVIAYVELDPRHAGQPEVLEGELHAHLAAALAPYKCPAEIIPMPSLPAAATGKILKSQLRTLAQQAAQTKETKQ